MYWVETVALIRIHDVMGSNHSWLSWLGVFFFSFPVFSSPFTELPT